MTQQSLKYFYGKDDPFCAGIFKTMWAQATPKIHFDGISDEGMSPLWKKEFSGARWSRVHIRTKLLVKKNSYLARQVSTTLHKERFGCIRKLERSRHESNTLSLKKILPSNKRH